MAILIELYEDYGTLTSGRGEYTKKIGALIWNNHSTDSTSPNWKALPNPTTEPVSGVNASYTRYIYAKVSGTYNATYSVYWLLEALDGVVDTGIDVYYQNTTSYATPTTSAMTGDSIGTTSGSPITPTRIVVPAGTSINGPNNATTYTQMTNNTTFYTSYLKTQMQVDNTWGVTGTSGTEPLGVSLIVVEQ